MSDEEKVTMEKDEQDVLSFLDSLGSSTEKKTEEKVKKEVEDAVEEPNEKLEEDTDDEEQELESEAESESEDETEDGEDNQEKDDEKEKLLERIAALEEMVRGSVKKEEMKEEELEPEEEKQKSPFDGVKFIESDEEFAEIVSDKEKFNGFITNLVSHVYEATMSKVPTVAANILDNRVNLQTAAANYINSNQDLFVGNIPQGADPNVIKVQRWKYWNKRITEIKAENPRLKIDDVLQKAGEDLQNIIGKPMGKAERKEYKDDKKKRTPFAKKGGSVKRAEQKKVDSFEDETSRMMAALTS